MSLSSEDEFLLPEPGTLKRQELTGPGISVGHDEAGSGCSGKTADLSQLLLWEGATTDRRE